MKWNDLTMKERSDLMSLFLKHGIGSLSDMRRLYDEGGEMDGGELEPAVVVADSGKSDREFRIPYIPYFHTPYIIPLSERRKKARERLALPKFSVEDYLNEPLNIRESYSDDSLRMNQALQQSFQDSMDRITAIANGSGQSISGFSVLPYMENSYISPYNIFGEGGRIYDGKQNTNNEDEDTYSGGILKEAKVSATLTRDEWNNLYREGKVSLSEIPRQYQSWIEGENSELKKKVTEGIDNFGKNYVYPAFTTILGANPVLGSASGMIEIGSDIIRGNWFGAGISLVSEVFPEFIEKPVNRFLRKKLFFRNPPKNPDFEGSESSVYIIGDRVFKVQDGGMAPMSKEEAERVSKSYITKRNSVPNQAPLKYEGVIPAKKSGLYHPVLSQERMSPLPENLSQKEQEYIWNKLDERMSPYGWKRQGGEYVSPEGVHVSDLKMENLAYGNDGKLYIIDGDTWKYGGLLHKYPDGGELKPATIIERVGRKWDNLYWQKFRKPKDYSDEVADTPDCARWSNAELRKRGYNIWGDAWTRSNNRAKKIVSGYDGLERPEEYSYSSYKDYVFGAADNVKKNFDWRDLEEGDIVGLYFRGSPNYQKAFLEGANGEAQTHTGHVVYRKRKPYIVHNVHGDIVMNKAKKLMGRKHPYGIVSVYRPYDFGGMLNF